MMTCNFAKRTTVTQVRSHSRASRARAREQVALTIALRAVVYAQCRKFEVVTQASELDVDSSPLERSPAVSDVRHTATLRNV